MMFLNNKIDDNLLGMMFLNNKIDDNFKLMLVNLILNFGESINDESGFST